MAKGGGERERLVLLFCFDDGHYGVTSASEPGLVHHLNLEAETCSCKAFTYRGACPHLALAWERLPKDAARRGRRPAWQERKAERARDAMGATTGEQMKGQTQGDGARGLLVACGIGEDEKE